MKTECKAKRLEFHPLRWREVRADFAGGANGRDGGGLPLREVEKRTGIIALLLPNHYGIQARPCERAR
jgi:hypothetical protein